MNVHKNARLTLHSRAELVRRVLEEGQSPKAVATAFGVDETENFLAIDAAREKPLNLD